MKKMNKLMAALLALVMCLSLLPMAAFAEETKNPEEAPFGEPYDGVITDAGEVEKDVPAAVEDANTAIEAIDQDTADKIGEAEKVVNDQFRPADRGVGPADRCQRRHPGRAGSRSGDRQRRRGDRRAGRDRGAERPGHCQRCVYRG